MTSVSRPQISHIDLMDEPASPSARKGITINLPTIGSVERRGHYEVEGLKEEYSSDKDIKDIASAKDDSTHCDSDIYDFNDSSPQVDKVAPQPMKQQRRRGSRASRRHSEVPETEEVYIPRDRSTSRRRSMMV